MQETIENLMMTEIWANTPIKMDFLKVTVRDFDALTMGKDPVSIEDTKNIKAFNAYYRTGMAGSHAIMRTRKIVLERLSTLADLFAPITGLFLFDAFRTIATQEALFHDFGLIIKGRHPEWSEEEVTRETLKFVAHPHDPSRFSVPPHNSGGAIDLCLYDIKSGKNWDFGTDIDEISDLSATEFFEKPFHSSFGIDEARWSLVRKNRRILFNAMKSVGFVSLPSEWWHYDIGNAHWAEAHGCAAVFESME